MRADKLAQDLRKYHLPSDADRTSFKLNHLHATHAPPRNFRADFRSLPRAYCEGHTIFE